MSDLIVTTPVLEHFREKMIYADAPSGGDDSAYLERIFSLKPVKLRAGATYIIGGNLSDEEERIFYLPANTNVDMNGATIQYKRAINNHSSQVCGDAEDAPSLWKTIIFNADPNNAQDRVARRFNGRGNIHFKNGKFDGCAFGLLHGKNITFENCEFTAVYTNHVFQICGCSDIIFKNCRFHGIHVSADAGTTQVINLDIAGNSGQFINQTWEDSYGTKTAQGTKCPWDNQWCQNIVVESCLFITDPVTIVNNNAVDGSVMYDVLGYHANWMQPDKDEVANGPELIPESDQISELLGNNKHRFIRATKNIIVGSVWSKNTKNTRAFMIRHMQDSIFSDNICRVVQSFFEADHASNIVIANNIVTGRGDISSADGNQFSNAFIIKRSWHSAVTWEGADKQFLTTSRHINMSNNMCNNVIFNNQMLISEKNSYEFASNPGKRPTTDLVMDPKIFTNQTVWVANTAAFPRFTKAGVVTTIHGRLKPKQAFTFSSESVAMILPTYCSPATTVTWTGTGIIYGSPNTYFSVLIKIKENGELSLTPVGGSYNLTATSDIWLDGTFVAFDSSFNGKLVESPPHTIWT